MIRAHYAFTVALAVLTFAIGSTADAGGRRCRRQAPCQPMARPQCRTPRPAPAAYPAPASPAGTASWVNAVQRMEGGAGA